MLARALPARNSRAMDTPELHTTFADPSNLSSPAPFTRTLITLSLGFALLAAAACKATYEPTETANPMSQLLIGICIGTVLVIPTLGPQSSLGSLAAKYVSESWVNFFEPEATNRNNEVSHSGTDEAHNGFVIKDLKPAR